MSPTSIKTLALVAAASAVAGLVFHLTRSDSEPSPASEPSSKSESAEVEVSDRAPTLGHRERPELPALPKLPVRRVTRSESTDLADREARLAARRARLLERFDTNGDGELDADERAARRALRAERREERMLEFFDSNGDGELDADERASRDMARRDRLVERSTRIIEGDDADGDGMLSLAEVEGSGGRAQRVLEDFAEIDKNGDEKISPDELADGIEARRAERRKRRQEASE